MSVRTQSDLFRTFDDVVEGQGSPKSVDRGLPDEKQRRDLAQTYLEIQNQLWPELVDKGILVPVDEQAVEQHAESLRVRFIEGVLDMFSVPIGLVMALAAAYLRYSCDNSNPRTLAQQLRNTLEGAKKLGYYIPWQYVFADAAISGMTSDRRGYQLCKELIRQPAMPIECLFVDEIGRANRDMIESLMLGRLIMHYDKRMIGVTDGLDSQQPFYRGQLGMFAMMHEQFVFQLKEKVNRGMRDKFMLGGNIRPPCLGYKVVNVLTPDGKVIIRPNKKILTERVIDEEEAEEVRRAFVHYGVDGWSIGRIARDFNRRGVGGSKSTDTSLIAKMLRRELYIGREYDKMTIKKTNPETRKITITKVPREQWLSRDIPQLRIIDDALWSKVQERLRICREACSVGKAANEKRGGKRSEWLHAYPRMLYRPICSHCKTELSLNRSGKHSSLCCINGSREKKDCPLRTSKAIKVIERVMAQFLTKEVLTKDFLEGIVKDANEFLERERLRPQKKIPSVPVGLKELIRKRNHLLALVEQYGAKDVATLLNRMRSLEREIDELEAQHEAEKAQNQPVPPAITLPDLATCIEDLTSLLNDDVAKAAPVLRLLLGPIEVEEDKTTSSKRPVWIARFTMNGASFLVHLAKTGKLPTTGSLEYLTTRSWKFSKKCSTLIRDVPIYEQIGPDVMALKSQGFSDEVIARRLQTTYSNVRYARLFAEHGTRPKAGPARKRTGHGIVVKYKAVADQVVYLRDVMKLHFHDIAKQLDCGEATVRRAYDYKNPQAVLLAIEQRDRPSRGRSSRLKAEVFQEIHRLLDLGGLSDCEIARQCECSANTVSRERTQLQSQRKTA